jgi:hypothetical protein
MSQETCFSIPYLYEMSLDIICFKGAFNAMALKYRYLHNGGGQKLDQKRVKLCEQRLREAWYLFSLIEQKQRYIVPGPVSRGDTIEICLKFYHPKLKLEFSRR